MEGDKQQKKQGQKKPQGGSGGNTKPQTKRKRSDGEFGAQKAGPAFKKQKGDGGDSITIKGNEESRGIKRSADDKKIDKREQKRLKREKKMKRPNAEMAYNAKLMWEEIRQKKISDEKRSQNIEELLDLMRGKTFEIVMKRDTSRVIQSVLKHGTAEQRQVVFDDLKDHVIEMAQNNYAHFIINKMLKYGDKEQRNLVIKQFYGKVRRLAKHKEASQVLEYIYCEHASAQQKSSLVEEFYGPEFSLFKTDEKRSLEDILEKDPQKKRTIINGLKDYLIEITNKAHAVLSNSIVHVPLLKYFEHGTYEDINEFLPFIRDHVVRILHTKEGAKVACHVLGYGKAKDRKVMVKSFKSYILKMAKEEFGHMVLLKAFECVDDTALLNKVIISELTEGTNLLEAVKDKHGRLVVFAAMETPTTKYYHPTTLDVLKPTMVPDETNPENFVPSSKKDEAARRAELRAAIFPSLFDLCKTSVYDMITDMFARNVFEEVYLQSKGEEERESLNGALLQFVDRPAELDEKPKDERKYHPMEKRPEEEAPKVDILQHTLAHRIVRRLIEEDDSLATRLVNKIKGKVLDYALEKSSSWVLLSLMEKPESEQAIKKLLMPSLAKLKAGEESGTKVIVQKLTGQEPKTEEKKEEKKEKKEEKKSQQTTKKSEQTPAKQQPEEKKETPKGKPQTLASKKEEGKKETPKKEEVEKKKETPAKQQQTPPQKKDKPQTPRDSEEKKPQTPRENKETPKPSTSRDSEDKKPQTPRENKPADEKKETPKSKPQTPRENKEEKKERPSPKASTPRQDGDKKAKAPSSQKK